MEMTEISQNKNSFSELTYKYLTECFKAYDTGDMLGSIIWGAVFVEALLKDILFALDKNEHDSELNQLLKDLYYYMQNRGDIIPGTKRNIFRDIHARCNEVRNKRNRLVHDTGVERSPLEVDARDVHTNILQIAKQYIKTDIADEMKKKNEPGLSLKTDRAEPDFPIFISTNTPHTFEQGEFIDEFCAKLREIGVKPVRCVMTDFDKKDPMGKVRDTIEACKAVIIIGLERSHVYFYRDKEGSEFEQESVHRKCTSGWLQIESGIANALRKPLFVMCQKDIHSDGIFDRSWNTYLPIEIDLPLDIDQQNVVGMLRQIKEFVSDYKE